MAKKQVIVSDLTGKEVEEREAVKVAVHRGPGVTRAVTFDAVPAELGDISDAPDIYHLEVRPHDPTKPPYEVLATLKDVKKVLPDGNVDQFLDDLPCNIGRPRGSRNA